MADLHDSVAFIQNVIAKTPHDPEALQAAATELEWALGEWPTSPQLLDAEFELTGLLEKATV